MLKFWFQSKFAWLILTVITVVLVLFWMFSWTSRLNQKPLFLEFSGFYILFSFQGSLLLSSQRQPIYNIISLCICQQLFCFEGLYTFKTAHWISSTSIFHPSGNNFLLPIQFLTISFWLSPRPISNSQLHALLHFHLCPIYLVVFKGSYYLRMGYLILRGASRLDAFSVYPVPAWLLCHELDSSTDTPEASPPRSSRTKGSSSQISYARAG